jgi:hypothetical protein
MLKAPSVTSSHNPCIAGSKVFKLKILETKALELIVVRRLIVNFVEPPSCSNAIVLIGKNNRGQWVAREQNGLFGGLFVSRTAAVRYALFENGHHPEAIFSSANPLELDMSTASPDRIDGGAVDAMPRRAA